MELNITATKFKAGKLIYQNLYTYDLKQRKITKAYIIKVNLHILPSGSFIVFYEFFTLAVIVDLADIKSLISRSVNTVIKFSSK